MLEPNEAIKYLLDRGLILESDIVDSGIDLEVVESKNLSYRVSTARRSVLLKRARLPGDLSVEKEADTYAALNHTRIEESIRLRLPEFIGYDREHGTLLLELVKGSSLRDYHKQTHRSSKFVGTEIATAIAGLHNIPLSGFSNQLGDASRPWVLRVLAPPIEALHSESIGTIDLIRRVQAHKILRRSIIEINELWQTDALCHNDIRLDNFLYPPLQQTPAKPHIYVLDWELCEPGWAIWDVACLLASYVALWIAPLSGDLTARQKEGKRMSRFHGVIRSFWDRYITLRHTSDDLPNMGRTIARLVGLRLVQSSLEYAQRSPEPTREAVVLLEAATGFCERPAASWVHILGLPLTRSFGRVTANLTSIV